MVKKSKLANAEDIALDIIVITGLSGSGMSSATNAFEDLGYFCVDNLPLTMLPTFARLVIPVGDDNSPIQRAALVIDIREGKFLSEFDAKVRSLKRQGLKVFVLFLEANDEVLQRRFSETRRPHPANTGVGLAEAIKADRRAMKKIRSMADLIVDTSEHTVHTLRRLLVKRFSPNADGTPMSVQVLSFGHKYGNPHDLELMLDVRHLPNPFFVRELRELSGHDKRVVQYLKQEPEVIETLKRFGELLEYLLPLYRREGKSYVTVGIGCTGGRHRSVMIANALAKRLRSAGFDARSVHRDVNKAKKRIGKA